MFSSDIENYRNFIKNIKETKKFKNYCLKNFIQNNKEKLYLIINNNTVNFDRDYENLIIEINNKNNYFKNYNSFEKYFEDYIKQSIESFYNLNSSFILEKIQQLFILEKENEENKEKIQQLEKENEELKKKEKISKDVFENIYESIVKDFEEKIFEIEQKKFEEEQKNKRIKRKEDQFYKFKKYIED